MAAIRFFSEQVRFKISHPRKTSNWIKKAIESESYALKSINIIFCSDSMLSELNVKYLKHKTLTDIITFDYAESKGTIMGDIFISIPRVRENAGKFKTKFDEELHRVIIHGVLHLMGFKDKNTRQKSIMRNKEDSYLSLRTD